MNNSNIKTLKLGDKIISFEIGTYAPRANMSIMASMGETVILCTVAISDSDTDRDYFPLSVEYVERMYAGGKISSSRFVKRERFPTVDATLKARMIDRSLRPLFPENFRREVQVVVTVLSYDDNNDPLALGLITSGLAVHLSEVPFSGPVTGLRIGYKEGKFLINPSNGDLEESQMDFILSGTGSKIVMIDAGSKEIEEKVIADLFDFACENFKPILEFQDDLRKEFGNEKIEYKEKELDKELIALIEKEYDKQIDGLIYEKKGNVPGEKRIPVLKDYVDEFIEKYPDKYTKSDVEKVFDKIMKKRVREGVLKEEKRASGRKLDEIRELNMKLGILPRTHGSALFSRGVTQALSVVTLGSTRLEQILESFEGDDTKRYMHHYNGPSYSYGQAGMYSYIPGRREIGHGALAEKALEPVIPSEDEFPYVIRVVSEILAQQGSSSMASTCGSTLALMDAGVPIKAPVAGISVGLVTSEDAKEYKLLTDIQDIEDFYGDMDFKVAGTEKGITAIQMDNKLLGVEKDILKEALKRAKTGRMFLLEEMSKIIDKPREKLSIHAPKITTLKINPAKISEVIGPGGKIIKKILEETGVEIDIQDDGSVHIAAVDEESRQDAINRINAITEEPEVGKIYTGKVASVKQYGVFVDVSRAISGLVHKSEISDEFVNDPSKVLKEGDEVKVKIMGIDSEGRINFSIKKAKDNN